MRDRGPRSIKQVVKLTLDEYNWLIEYTHKNRTNVAEALRHGALTIYYAETQRESAEGRQASLNSG